MATGWYTHDDCAGHVTPPGHPERVARLEAVNAALADVPGLDRRAAPLGTRDHVLLCHPEAHIAHLEANVPSDGWAALDGDTFLAPGSLNAAYRAVGGCVAAVDAVLDNELANAFVGCRPPGHHAEKTTPMGFCLFGNVSIAAMHAVRTHGLAKVAILDFDVHHGNGTQDLIWDVSEVFFTSSHQMPLYPGTGAPHETGAHGNVLNVPLNPMSGGTEMRAAYERQVLPTLREQSPELILISAGFDAHEADPLANLNWTEDDFAWVTNAICDVADEVAEGRVVSTLEGGYDLTALGASVAAHVAVLEERGR